MKTIANRIVQDGSALKSDENIQKLLEIVFEVKL